MFQLPLIHGQDTTGIIPVLVDSLGYLRVKDKTGNTIIGFMGAYYDGYTNTNIGAGSNNFQLTVVPAGYHANITMYSFNYVGTLTTVTVRLACIIGGSTAYFKTWSGLTSGIYYSEVCDLHLDAGDNIFFRVTGCTAGDDFNAYTVGVKSYM
jgi:hypothetical protein